MLLRRAADGGIVAIEIKLADRHRPADIRHIEWLANKIGDRFKLGLRHCDHGGGLRCR